MRWGTSCLICVCVCVCVCVYTCVLRVCEVSLVFLHGSVVARLSKLLLPAANAQVCLLMQPSHRLPVAITSLMKSQECGNKTMGLLSIVKKDTSFFHKTQLWIWLKHTAAVVQLWVSAKAFCSCWSNSSDSSGLENWFQSWIAGFTLLWFAWLLEPTQMLCKSFVLCSPLKETTRNLKR